MNRFLAPTLILTSLLSACGGGSSTTAPPADPPASLTAALSSLGVDTAQTPRLGEDGSELADYSPLGARWDAFRPAELFVAGIPMKGLEGSDLVWLEDAGTGSLGSLDPLYDGEADWADEAVSGMDGHVTSRAFAKADLDADGRDEVAALRIVGSSLFLSTWEDGTEVDKAEASATEQFLGDFGAVRSVSLCAGDFDGDARDELMIGYTYAGSAVVEVYDQQQGAFVLVPGSTRTLDPQSLITDLSLVLDAGNHDQDDGFEAVVVVNERNGDTALSAFTLYDDLGHGFSVVASGPVQHVPSAGTPEQAVVASAAFGDVDGDGFEELVLGGLVTVIHGACEATGYVGMALEDLAHGGGLMGSIAFSTPWTECNDVGYEVDFAHVVTLDLDGDGMDEVVLNREVFGFDLTQVLPWTPEVDSEGQFVRLPEDLFFDDQTSEPFARGNSVMVAGDVMALGREQLLFFRQDFGADIEVFGMGPTFEAAFELDHYGSIPTALAFIAPDTDLNAIILTPNVDEDSITMVRETVEHEVIFTEPLILAVLAAPPTVAGIDQNYGDSATTYGNTSYSGEAKEASLTVKASASVGIKVTGGIILQSEAEMKATVSLAASVAVGEAYTISETVSFTTGVNEDSVVFTCIPLDRYVYRIESHYDEELIDAVVTVDLPRSPVSIQVEREFYNASIADGSPIIDLNVLQHTIGDIESYPNKTKKNQLVLQHDGITSSTAVSVGAGSGSSGISLELDESSSFKAALEVGFELSVQVTAATVLAGFTVGGSVGASLQTVVGSAIEWSGTVGDIAPSDFAENAYQYGLFTYYYSDPATGQKFQVVNYWVE